jgi:Sel1 repeat
LTSLELKDDDRMTEIGGCSNNNLFFNDINETTQEQLIMPITEIASVLTSIMTLANNIYTQVQLVKTNQTQCQELTEIVKTIVGTVDTITSRLTERYLFPLSKLLKCLQDCQAFIESNIKLNLTQQFFQARDIKKNFKNLMRALQLLQTNFQTALVGGVVDQLLTDRQLKEKEEAEIFYQQGREYERSEKLTEANTAYTEAMNRGHVKAMTNLGLFRLNGIPGTLPDKECAHRYLLSAAEQGHPRAMHNLARMYKIGDGVGKNAALAAQWYEKEQQTCKNAH